MKLNRAYSLLEIKAVDEDQRVISGIATTPTPDRAGDVVVPKGAEYTLPIPLLWQHDSSQPIGFVTDAKVTANGIEIIAQIAKDVSNEIDQAWTLIKSGLVRGLSIGFRALDTEQIPNSWGVIFNKWEWLELSAVTIPANAEASIQTVKSIDTEIRAASGIQDEVREEKGTPPTAVKPVHVAKLNPARVRAKPFVIREIRHLTSA
jgi:HK97 family phage prohead protease